MLEAGVHVSKPKQWLDLARRAVQGSSCGEVAITDRVEDSLDAFLETWGSAIVAKKDIADNMDEAV